jgi:hypothetical protein
MKKLRSFRGAETRDPCCLERVVGILSPEFCGGHAAKVNVETLHKKRACSGVAVVALLN